MNEDVDQILATGEVVAELVGQVGDYTALYLTLLSGYLIVAYVQGKHLSRMQAAIITTLFLCWTFVNTLSSVSALNAAVYFGHTYGAGLLPEWGSLSIAVLQGLGTLAALKFMWDVRHPKTE